MFIREFSSDCCFRIYVATTGEHAAGLVSLCFSLNKYKDIVEQIRYRTYGMKEKKLATLAYRPVGDPLATYATYGKNVSSARGMMH